MEEQEDCCPDSWFSESVRLVNDPLSGSCGASRGPGLSLGRFVKTSCVEGHAFTAVKL